MNKIKKNYEEAWKTLIRPIKYTYSLYNLGNHYEEYDGRCLKRIDFKIENNYKYMLQCCIFIPFEYNTNIETVNDLMNKPLIIYLHTQSGCSIEGLILKEYCANNDFGLCLFDFSGSGLSEGDYVTLGYRESQDLEILINYLIKYYKVGPIALYGRSMGAATALFYCKRNNFMINCMVLDSPFSCVETMIKDLAYKKLKLPSFFVSLALKFLSKTIIEKVHFDLISLKPIEAAKHCNVPCLLIYGENDELVRPERVIEIKNNYFYKSPKIWKSSYGHADTREDNILNQSFEFIKENFNNYKKIDPKKYTNVKEEIITINNNQATDFKKLALDFRLKLKNNLKVKKKLKRLNSERQLKVELNTKNIKSNENEDYGINYKYDDGLENYEQNTKNYDYMENDKNKINLNNLSKIEEIGENSLFDSSILEIYENIIPNIKDELLKPKNKFK